MSFVRLTIAFVLVLTVLASQSPLFHVEDIKFPLSTEGRKIVDATGRRVKLAGGNYAGSHMIRHCVNGLEFRQLRDIALDIRFKFKMNCIRLTYSLQMIQDNNVVDAKYLKANPELIGKTSLEIFDFVIETLTDVGLMVILNNHISSSMWCCKTTDGNGLWWTLKYPERKYFQHASDFAKRYKTNHRVIGIDLRNQIRMADIISPTWGTGIEKTDWKRAAQITAQLVLKQAPSWLIIIGGINFQTDLTGVHKHPIQLTVSNKLVYSGHLYSWQGIQPKRNVTPPIKNYEQFKQYFYEHQTFVRDLGVPFLLGQFGKQTTDDNYWRWMIQYLKQTDIDWTYWCLDGFKGDPYDPNMDEPYGIFNHDFSAVRNPEILNSLISVGPTSQALDNYQKYYPKKYIQEQQQLPQNQHDL